ncbi:hypothetical protein F1643_03700 [Azospirillum sp. INR13]|uniref:DUF6602 domain-containing protein n=1 Tax=Azospirillum sp. INR13 TaxID=2596919 RepID=UPI0018923C77|nr:DUF6602 domain-containing protein [Azospirillum sp. INR13]MBF5093730.1 hypothetical protein [Azospirillum sp. INR13]
MNPIIEKLAREHAASFRRNFLELSRDLFENATTGKLYHPGEFGGYRERLLKRMLLSFLPSHFACSEGFVIGHTSKVDPASRSTQCDVIVYDENETPKLETGDLRRFFPVETVYGVGEIKSVVEAKRFEEILDKLSKVKRMRVDPPPVVYPTKPTHMVMQFFQLHQAFVDEGFERRAAARMAYDVFEHPAQNIVTFLVCERIEFSGGDNLSSLMKRVVSTSPGGDEQFAMRHNMILSIEDGYQSYFHGHGIPTTYPRVLNENLGMSAATGVRIVDANDRNDHIIAFLGDIASALGNAMIFPFNVSSYINVEATNIGW